MSDVARLYSANPYALVKVGSESSVRLHASTGLLLNKANVETPARIYSFSGFIMRRVQPTVALRDESTPVRRLTPYGWVALYHPSIAGSAGTLPVSSADHFSDLFTETF